MASHEATEQVLKWVREVYPSTNPESGGAVVHMTWDEFNAMREFIGLKPLKPSKPTRKRASPSVTEQEKT